METSRNRHSSTALLAVMFILLADAGIAIWYWHMKSSSSEDYFQPRQHLYVPTPETPLPPSPQPSSDSSYQANSTSQDSTKMFVGDSGISVGTAGSSRGSQAQAAGSSSSRSAGKGGALDKAAEAIINFQRSSTYMKSAALHKWSHDFLSHPDLREVNARYWKDHDAMAFVLGTVRSPNFGKMLKDYAASADLGNAVKSLLYDPSIQEASKNLIKNPEVFDAVKNVTLPGLPPVGVLMAMGDAQDKGQNPLALPAVQQYLQTQTNAAALMGQPSQ